MADANLTAARARELLDYDPETGLVTRKVALSGAVRVGDKVGAAVGNGYLMAWCAGSLYLVHRLIFLLQTGEWPRHQVDHLNGIRTDNRWTNLRDVSHQTNGQNRRASSPKRKNALPLGVALSSTGKRFTARLQTGAKNRYLGTFDTPDLAHLAYLDAKRRLHTGCTI